MADFRHIQTEFHRRADAKRFWNRLANPYLRPKEKRLAWRVAEKMPDGGNSFLEIGCGEGSNFYYLRAQLPDKTFVGLDFSFEKVRFLRLFLGAVKAVCGDAANLPFSDDQFDLIVCRDLLHHIHFAKEQVLSEAFRVLKPQGMIVIFESNGKRLLNRLFQIFSPVERGMKDSTPERLKTLGAKFGKVNIEFVEASFLVRAFAFPFGWPKGFGKYLVVPVYCLAYTWERIFKRIAPRNKWTYMMMSLRMDQ